MDFVAPPPDASCHFISDMLEGGTACDWVSIPVTAGKRYRMTFCDGAGPADSDGDVVLRLYDSACNMLTLNDDSCAGGLSEITWDAGVDDIWRLQIANAILTYPNPTTYTLCILEVGDACDSCAWPSAVTLFPAATCQYHADFTRPFAGCDADFYQVFLQNGVTYRFSTCPAPLPLPPRPTCPGASSQDNVGCDPSLAWDVRIEIFPPGCAPGTELTPGPIGSGGCDVDPGLPDFVYLHAGPTGYYILHVGQEDPAGDPAACSNHGRYTLAYQSLGRSCASCASGPYVNGATPLVPTPACQTLSGVIDACDDEWIELDLIAGTRYEFTTCDTPGGCVGGVAVPVTRLELFSFPSCALLAATVSTDFCSATGAKLTFTPMTAGIFRLHVAGVAGQIGPYTLTYREGP